MGATRTLADYVAQLSFDEIPDEVAERAKLGILDTLGVGIGGLGVPDYSHKFLELAQAVGGAPKNGNAATLLGDGGKVSLPFAAFGNTALVTALDFCDFAASKTRIVHSWPGALAVPAALGAVEVSEGNGKDLIAATVAGYETVGRIIRSMDMTRERELDLKGETMSIFGAAAGAARGLRLSGDEVASTLEMTGIATPVPAGYKWVMDVGLRPRKDIKQGWAWMALGGVLAAESARRGFEARQENGILDGPRGLWRMLGMDSFDEAEITRDLGTMFITPSTTTKLFPGCGTTHSAIMGALDLVRENDVVLDEIVEIEVVTDRRCGIEEDDCNPATAQDMQFSIPYQVGAALAGYPPGPQWYTVARERAVEIARKTSLTFDAECEAFWEDNLDQMTKVKIVTRDGPVLRTRREGTRVLSTRDEITKKFLDCTTQVIGVEPAGTILDLVEHLEAESDVRRLVDLVNSAVALSVSGASA
jgi:2-methylcitrate dehydratase PrpD